ncbi:oligosaccharide flippase family protein [Weizmannia coagulans]|uniref:Membrane protein n=2 Tax=Heyndrickxia TaxID=2837504 RepID=A0AAN0WDF3_HEYCO|nr:MULTISPECIES: oligosaccharide flippase family protein [Heyndrickxia]AJO24451.1 membrane protein [Heyndrickxia coagulans]AKN54083.1 polysaccharide biosynthesis protein [Heyndrickxia coagulans]APB38209.1 hypothetical protein BIZ35_16530 [Heyndrickxia coagulans]ATW84274.1 hypothetical protein CIW84_15515 [Heyndrickxia coagulans]KGB30367.1 hypothetical protein IE89_05150 [Heyndrickxia coagulans]
MRSKFYNVAWIIYGQGGRLIFQTAYFFLLAIIMNPKQYGIYVAITSLIVILGPFCGVGFNSLIVKIIATDVKEFRNVFGNTIKITIYSYFILLLVGELIIFLLYRNQILVNMLFLILSLADLLFLKLNEMSAQIFIAKNRVNVSANIQNFISLTRFMSVVIFYFLHDNSSNDILIWSMLYLLISLLYTILVFIYTLTKNDLPNMNSKITFNNIKEGIFFSIGLSSQGIYNDIDKTILGKYDSFQQTGYYGFAYKMLDVIFIPIKAILSLTFPKFFKIGKNEGIKGTYKFAKRILFPLIIYCIIASIASLLLAPTILARFNNGEYEESLYYFNILLIIVFLRCVHYVLSDSLTGAGLQKERSIVQLTIAAINTILNFILISYYKVYGAIIVSIFSDALMAISIICIVRFKITKRQNRNENL